MDQMILSSFFIFCKIRFEKLASVNFGDNRNSTFFQNFVP